MEQMLQYTLMDEAGEELAAEYGLPLPSVSSTVYCAITQKLSILHAAEIPLAIHVARYNSVGVHHALHVTSSGKIVVSEPGHAYDAQA
jgi:hypothetical protein